MKGYLILNYNVTDGVKFTEYKEKVFPIIAQYNGKPLVVSPEPEVLEGSPNAVIVVIEFERVDTAKTFLGSDEYAAIHSLRTDSTDGWVLVAPEFVAG